MPPKKKQKALPPPQPRFAPLRIASIGANPRQTQIWLAKVGAGSLTAVSKSDAAAGKLKGTDYTHIVSSVADGALATSVRADVGAGPHLVTESWLTRTLGQSAGLAPEASFLWAAPAPAVETAPAAAEPLMLPKFACQRSTTLAGDKNPAITKAISTQIKWWENGYLDGQERAEYMLRAAQWRRLLGIVRSWPRALDADTWEEERPEFIRQHYISSEGSSLLAYLEQLVLGGPEGVERPDAFPKWAADPTRRAVFEMMRLKVHLTRAKALELVRDHGVTGAADLVARRDQLPIPEFARDGLGCTPLGCPPMDRAETTAILGVLEAAAAAIGLKMTVCGSYRRGTVGGHDIDVVLHADPAGPAVMPEDYAFQEREGPGNRLLAAYFSELERARPGFLHPHRTNATGANFGGDKTPPRLGVRYCVVRSPVVDGACRRVDVILAPTDILAHAILGWSGTTSFQRSLADYVNRTHQGNWAHVPDGKPVVGRAGWELGPGLAKGRRVEGRELRDGEHWNWSKHGVYIGTGSRGGAENDYMPVYQEDNASLRTERDVFEFFHLTYLEPHEREC